MSPVIKNRSLSWIELQYSLFKCSWRWLAFSFCFEASLFSKTLSSTQRQPRHVCVCMYRQVCVCVCDRFTFSALWWNKSNINDTQTFFSPHWLAFFLFTTVLLSQISHHSLIFSPSLTYSQPLPPSLLFSPAALPSVPPSQTTCYSVQGGCRQHCCSSPYCCCRTRLFYPLLSLFLSDNQTFPLIPFLILLKLCT